MKYILLLLFYYIHISIQDLPPHCLHGDILGTWKIHSGQWKSCPAKQDYNDLLCGYSLPDDPTIHETHGLMLPNISSHFIEDHAFKITFTPTQVIEIEGEIFDDNVSTKGFSRNDWTMVYDEGIHFNYHNITYFAYFKYKTIIGTYPIKIQSFCSSTMIGWWSSNSKFPLKTKTGCWYGEQIMDQAGRSIDLYQWTNEIPKDRPSLVEIAKHVPIDNPTDNMENLVEYILHLTPLKEEGTVHWKPISTPFITVGDSQITTMEELNKAIGTELSYRKRIELPEKSMNYYFPLNSLPLIWEKGNNFDWSNEDDVNSKFGIRESLVPTVDYQGICGSCYALAATKMLTSRLWIKYAANNKIRNKIYVSSFSMINCSPYNQGCLGGYIYLALKHAAEHGLPTTDCVNECFKNIETSLFVPSYNHTVATLYGNDRKCFDIENLASQSVLQCREPLITESTGCCKQRITVSDWGYIGGAYGRSNEKEMRASLQNKGPIAASIEPTPEFTIYQDGVFHSKIKFDSEYRDTDDLFPWEKVDHAILVVGYGVEVDPITGQGIPYWKALNSWGQKWGNNGYFKILRGYNELGIESIAVEGSADIIIKE